MRDFLEEKSFIKAVFSSPRQHLDADFKKATIRLVALKDTMRYHITEYKGQQVFHQNKTKQACQEYIDKELFPRFKRGAFYTVEHDYMLLMKDLENIKIVKQAPSQVVKDFAHNRFKKTIFQEGVWVDFLEAVGIMDREGRVFPKKMRKFRQINHFLSIVEESISVLGNTKVLRIIDMGCGKAYLSFALYYFLCTLKGYQVTLLGIDLKKSVIADAQALVEKLRFTGMRFEVGDLSKIQLVTPVDMVVSLHACDTATDYALAKAVALDAKVLLMAPCCQQALYQEISSDALPVVLEYGLLKERLCALLTDAARGKLLEIYGYQTSFLEFVDPEHTPKNLLIRAILAKTSEKNRLKALQSYEDLKKQLQVSPLLEQLLNEHKKTS